jgi:carbonic anhydrase
MSDNFSKILEANYNYSKEFGDKSEFEAPPKRKIAILTCMDARLNPSSFAGLREGDAHVIRNAGGRASRDAIRSLVISYKLLGTREWYIIHHTDCGMASFTNEIMVKQFSHEEVDEKEQDQWEDFKAAKELDWLTFKDPALSLIDDVKTIRNHPLVPDYIPIYGLIFNVKTGRLEEVKEANEAGMVVETKT